MDVPISARFNRLKFFSQRVYDLTMQKRSYGTLCSLMRKPSRTRTRTHTLALTQRKIKARTEDDLLLEFIGFGNGTGQVRSVCVDNVEDFIINTLYRSIAATSKEDEETAEYDYTISAAELNASMIVDELSQKSIVITTTDDIDKAVKSQGELLSKLRCLYGRTVKKPVKRLTLEMLKLSGALISAVEAKASVLNVFHYVMTKSIGALMHFLERGRKFVGTMIHIRFIERFIELSMSLVPFIESSDFAIDFMFAKEVTGVVEFNEKSMKKFIWMINAGGMFAKEFREFCAICFQHTANNNLFVYDYSIANGVEKAARAMRSIWPTKKLYVIKITDEMSVKHKQIDPQPLSDVSVTNSYSFCVLFKPEFYGEVSSGEFYESRTLSFVPSNEFPLEFTPRTHDCMFRLL